MKLILAAILIIGSLSLTSSCSRREKEENKERANEIQEKSKDAVREIKKEAEKVGSAVKNEAREISATANKPLGGDSGTSQSAEEKLKRGTAEFQKESEQAARKLARAAEIAKVKSKLASTVGLSTVANIEVEPNGNTIRLRGTVETADQRLRAERAVLELEGVTKVVNDLQVKP